MIRFKTEEDLQLWLAQARSNPLRLPVQTSSAMSYLLLQMAHHMPPIPPWEAELEFSPTRKWRADLAWPDHKILVEVDGAVFTKGRHTRGVGFEKDAEKLNAAALLGYRVFRFTPGMIKSNLAIRTLLALFTTEET
jgi:hypothetical protein